MRDYAKIRPAFWTGPTARALRAQGAHGALLVAQYLATCPSSNMIGLYYLPMVVLAHETGMDLAAAAAALRALAQVDYAHYDAEHEIVWVPGMAADQIGESLSPKDNRCKAVVREAERYRGCRFFVDFIARYGQSFSLIQGSEATPEVLASPFEAPREPLRSPSRGPCKPLRSQDQDQDQEQEQEQLPPRDPLVPVAPPDPTPLVEGSARAEQDPRHGTQADPEGPLAALAAFAETAGEWWAPGKRWATPTGLEPKRERDFRQVWTEARTAYTVADMRLLGERVAARQIWVSRRAMTPRDLPLMLIDLLGQVASPVPPARQRGSPLVEEQIDPEAERIWNGRS